ncbi:hypothetical protein VTK73DRAFT_4637 [Phialemonium thermophilum]|uniref:Uncharacterized protein n=1 Tax=Phialemonium thermophilum TaxID=223376 RepID=A0ABR3V961_9PEZI
MNVPSDTLPSQKQYRRARQGSCHPTKSLTGVFRLSCWGLGRFQESQRGPSIWGRGHSRLAIVRTASSPRLVAMGLLSYHLPFWASACVAYQELLVCMIFTAACPFLDRVICFIVPVAANPKQTNMKIYPPRDDDAGFISETDCEKLPYSVIGLYRRE